MQPSDGMILDLQGADECPLLAKTGLPGHVAATSGLTQKADIRAAASAFRPLPPTSPSGADFPDDADVRLVWTLERFKVDRNHLTGIILPRG